MRPDRCTESEQEPEKGWRATELRIRAELRLGELLMEGANGAERKRFAAQGISPRDIGISEYQSHYWQTMAALPVAEREA